MGYLVIYTGFVILLISLEKALSVVTRFDQPRHLRRHISPSFPNWEYGLKEAVYKTLVRTKHINTNLRQPLLAAPFIGRQDTATPFGDITILARGQLYSAPGGFQFVQDPYENDCDGCHNTPLNCNQYRCENWKPAHHERLLALWTVKRIRHRENHGHRFEIDYKVSPITKSVTRNGKFDYNIPGHVYVTYTDDEQYFPVSDNDWIPNFPPQFDLQPAHDWIPRFQHFDNQYLPPVTPYDDVFHPNSLHATKAPQFIDHYTTKYNTKENEHQLYQHLLDTLAERTTMANILPYLTPFITFPTITGTKRTTKPTQFPRFTPTNRIPEKSITMIKDTYDLNGFDIFGPKSKISSVSTTTELTSTTPNTLFIQQPITTTKGYVDLNIFGLNDRTSNTMSNTQAQSTTPNVLFVQQPITTERPGNVLDIFAGNSQTSTTSITTMLTTQQAILTSESPIGIQTTTLSYNDSTQASISVTKPLTPVDVNTINPIIEVVRAVTPQPITTITNAMERTPLGTAITTVTQNNVHILSTTQKTETTISSTEQATSPLPYIMMKRPESMTTSHVSTTPPISTTILSTTELNIRPLTETAVTSTLDQQMITTPTSATTNTFETTNTTENVHIVLPEGQTTPFVTTENNIKFLTTTESTKTTERVRLPKLTIKRRPFLTKLITQTTATNTTTSTSTTQPTVKHSSTMPPHINTKHKPHEENFDDLFGPTQKSFTTTKISSKHHNPREIDDIFGAHSTTTSTTSVQEETPKIIFSEFYSLSTDPVLTTETTYVSPVRTELPTSQSYSTSITFEVNKKNKTTNTSDEVHNTIQDVNENDNTNSNKRTHEILTLSVLHHARTIDYLNTDYSMNNCSSAMVEERPKYARRKSYKSRNTR